MFCDSGSAGSKTAAQGEFTSPVRALYYNTFRCSQAIILREGDDSRPRADCIYVQNMILYIRQIQVEVE